MDRKSLFDIAEENNICILAQIELVTACNWRCKHCYIPKHDSYGLPYNQLIDIFRQLREMGTFEIVFTGGEIFMRDDIFEIIYEARNMGFQVQLLSNLSLLTDEGIEKLSNAYIDLISCTVFSMNESVHDSITGVKGSLKKTLRNIDKLIAKGIAVEVKTILFKDTYLEYKGVHEFCLDRGIPHIVTANLFARHDGSTDVLDMALEQNQLNEIIKEIDEIRGFTKREIDENTSACCSLINYSLFIDFQGFIYPCNSLLVKIGDVHNELISEVWNKSEFQSKMRKLKYKDLTNCSNCENLNYCYRCPGIAFSEMGDVRSSYPLECKHALARRLND